MDERVYLESNQRRLDFVWKETYKSSRREGDRRMEVSAQSGGCSAEITRIEASITVLSSKLGFSLARLPPKSSPTYQQRSQGSAQWILRFPTSNRTKIEGRPCALDARNKIEGVRDDPVGRVQSVRDDIQVLCCVDFRENEAADAFRGRLKLFNGRKM